MILSSKVSSKPRSLKPTSKTARPSRSSPFGNLNATQVPRQFEIEREQRKANKPSSKTERKKGHGRQDDSERDPMHALRMQRRLSSVTYGERARVKSSLEHTTSFKDFDLLPIVKESIAKTALNGLEEISPTPIQRLAIPSILQEGDRRRHGRRHHSNQESQMQAYLLAAETGSGKTLAYVLPLIDGIKRRESVDKEQAARDAQQDALERQRMQKSRLFDLPTPELADSSPDTARPRAIILLPTAELVTQVGAVVKSLSHVIKYRTAVISAAVSPIVIRNRLFSAGGVDIVISTPHLISSIAENDPNILSRVEYLVVDEADSLLDRSFSPITSGVIDRATPSLKKLIFCSATIPRSLTAYLDKRYPETRRLATPNLHAVPRRVQLSVVDIDKIPFQGNRQLACAQVIWDIGKEPVEGGESRERKIIVFVNERKEAATIAQYLKSKGIDAFEFSRDVEQREDREILSQFVAEQPVNHKKLAQAALTDLPGEPELAESATRTAPRTLPQTKVLVTTDIASRGIDTTPVRHVVLYDVPHTSIDFLHRLGRVGRMGRRGRGIVLVGRKDRKDIVKEVREGMFRGAALI